jgi:predicted RNase H-like HicB family nuclease
VDEIRVIYHCEDGNWWAESPDADGWYAAADTFEECRALSEEGIRFALDRGDVQISHYVPAPA